MDFVRLFRPYLRTIFIAFVCLIFTNVSALALPWSVKLILDEVLAGGRHALLWWILSALAVIFLLRVFSAYAGSYLGMRIAEKSMRF